MRKMLLLVATKRYVSVNKIYIVSLSIKGEVQTASKKEWNFYLKLSALIKEKMKKLYRSIFIKFMVIKQTHLFQSWMNSSYGDIKLILNTTYEEILRFYHSNETS